MVLRLVPEDYIGETGRNLFLPPVFGMSVCFGSEREIEGEREKRRRGIGERGEGSYKQSHLLLPAAVASLSICSSILPAGVVSGFHPETTVIILTVEQVGFVAYCNREDPYPGNHGESCHKGVKDDLA